MGSYEPYKPLSSVSQYKNEITAECKMMDPKQGSKKMCGQALGVALPEVDTPVTCIGAACDEGPKSRRADLK